MRLRTRRRKVITERFDVVALGRRRPDEVKSLSGVVYTGIAGPYNFPRALAIRKMRGLRS